MLKRDKILEVSMQKIFRLLLFGASILSACSAIPAAPQTDASVTAEAPLSLPTTAVPDSKPISTVGTPHIDQPPNPEGPVTSAPPDTQNCGYQWAYQDLPALSSTFQQALQALQPEAQGTAFAFGENCMLPDGSVGSFLPMETDFNLTLQVNDLSNESELGEWIVKAMQVIQEIPPDQIIGPRPGRVTLTFQTAGEQKNIVFYINQYEELPAGLSSPEIFQQLQLLQ
jgi:hypothetical protein